MITEYVTLLCASLFFLLHLSKFAKHIIKFKVPNLFLSFFSINILLLLIIEVLILSDILSLYKSEAFTRVLTTSLFSFILLFVSYLTITELSRKKLQVLWKIPLVGLLAGLYFEYRYTALICLGYICISLFMVISKRDKFKFLIKKVLFWVLPLLITYMAGFNRLVGLNITLILIIIGSSSILDLVLINSNFKKADS